MSKVLQPRGGTADPLTRGTVRVSRDHPCPVCKKPDWCLVREDGTAVICQRVKSGKRYGKAGWLHQLDTPIKPPAGPKRKPAVPPADWPAEAERAAAKLTAARKRELADRLKLPTAALDAIPRLGFRVDDAGGPCFTFPEVDAAGTVIGINRRYADGRKKAMPGGRRGLTLPSGWQDRPGPVFVVEGPTDAAALTAAGLACVGRPSNTGGAALLAGLFKNLPADRPVLVVGENDKKANGLWPGKEGAEHVAGELAKALGRWVGWALPPPDAKDVREWLTADARGDAGWPDRGAELSGALTGAAATIVPSAGLVGSVGRQHVGGDAAPRANGTPRQLTAHDDMTGRIQVPSDDEYYEWATMYKYNPSSLVAERQRMRQRGLPVSEVMRVVKFRATKLPDKDPATPVRQDYVVAHGRIWKTSANGNHLALGNFTARIVADVRRDDGEEQQHLIRVAGHLDTGGELPEIEVTTTEFAEMAWPLTKWGTRAIVFPGQEKQLRTALQWLSLIAGDVRQETVYTHTGWREIDGRWVYLHAGGAIGANGPAAGVRVELHPQLARFALPDPPAGDRLRAAVRASLGLLRDLAHDDVAVPLLIAPYRAALGGPDYSFALIGRTGAGKSQLAALAQQHFGPEMDGLHLPGNWISTANATEGLAFAAKDALLVIDDFCPSKLAPNEAQKLQATAERLIRGQGNHAGRSRMTAGGQVKAGRGPRGTLFVTGEDTPGGASLRARLWAVDVAAGSVNFKRRLSECQRDAAAGLYADALAGYVRWLAADLPARRERFRAEMERRRAQLSAVGGHTRVPTAAADLLAGLDLLLAFAAEVRAVTPAEAEGYRDRGRAAVLRTAELQAEHQRDADPVARFASLVGSVVSSGLAHLADRKTGKEPHDGTTPDGAGWRLNGGRWEPQGRCIGWVGGGHVLLDPNTALAVVCKVAADGGNPLSVTERMLWRMLHEHKPGFLAETMSGDGKPTRYVIPRTVGGHRKKSVVVLYADRLSL